MFKHRVAKIMIMNMLNQAQNYVYMMSPYLIIDNELCQAMENAAMRGIDVRIITPHIPDKKVVFVMTRSYYKRLMDAEVKIYEFEPGFVHAKVYHERNLTAKSHSGSSKSIITDVIEFALFNQLQGKCSWR